MPVPGQGSQCCPGLAGGLSEGLFERVCYKRRGARRIETDFPALQGVLLGTAPLGCVEITFCCSCTGREELVLLGSFGSPPSFFFFIHKGSCSSLALLALRSSRRELPLQKARARGQKLSGSTRSRNTRVLS